MISYLLCLGLCWVYLLFLLELRVQTSLDFTKCLFKVRETQWLARELLCEG